MLYQSFLFNSQKTDILISRLSLNTPSVPLWKQHFQTLVNYCPYKQQFLILATKHLNKPQRNRATGRSRVYGAFIWRGNYDMSSQCCYLRQAVTFCSACFNSLGPSTHENVPKRGISSLLAVHGPTADEGKCEYLRIKLPAKYHFGVWSELSGYLLYALSYPNKVLQGLLSTADL